MTPTSRSPRALWLIVLVCALGAIIWLWPSSRTHSNSDDKSAEDSAEAQRGLGHGSGGRFGVGDATLPDEPDPADGLPLTGRVVFPDGRPAEGATVRLLSRPAGAPRVNMLRREAHTDPEGGFVFDRQARGDYLLEAQTDDAVSPTTPYRLVADGKPVVLMLFPAAALAVHVLSAVDGRPIAHATVKLGIGNPTLGGADAFRQEFTGADGVARFRGVTPIANHPLWAEAPGFSGSYLNLRAREHLVLEWETRILLKPGATITGRVVDEKGNGIAGAKLGWQLGPGEVDGAHTTFIPFADAGRYAAPSTDSDGHFTKSAEPGVGCLVAVHARHLTAQACNLRVEVGKVHAGVEIVMKSGAHVSGTVVGVDGKPVAGADVIVTQVGWNHQSMWSDLYRVRATSDGNGKFDLAGVDRIPVALAASSDDASSELVELDLTSTAEKSDVKLTLANAGKIEGTVVEADGRPVPYSSVDYYVNPDFEKIAPGFAGGQAPLVRDYTLPKASGGTVTDGEGHFVLRALPKGRYTVRAVRPAATGVDPNYTSAYQQDVMPGQTARLVLPGLGAVSGRVTFADGQPALSFGVSFTIWSPELEHGGLNVPRPVSTTDGHFVLDGVPANRYLIAISGPGIVEWRTPKGIDVSATGTTDLGTIVVGGGKERDGVVLSEHRDPVVGAAVSMVALDQPDVTVNLSTDDEGVFHLPAVRADQTIKVRAHSEQGTGSDWIVVSPATDHVEIVLGAGGRGNLSGILIDPGNPLDGRTVLVTLNGTGFPGTLRAQANSVTQAGGRFRIDGLAPGDYLVWVRRADAEGRPVSAAQWISQAVSIQDAKTAQLIIEVPSPVETQ